MAVTKQTTKQIRLTRAQRRLLFVVGAFNSRRYYGTSGKMIRWDCLWKVREFGLIDGGGAKDVLTEAGKVRFDAEFGDPCAGHGWQGVVDGLDGEYRRCPTCRAAHKRVNGYEMAAPLLMWERVTLEAVARGDRGYFQTSTREGIYAELELDQRKRNRQKLTMDGLLDASGEWLALTEEGAQVLRDFAEAQGLDDPPDPACPVHAEPCINDCDPDEWAMVQ